MTAPALKPRIRWSLSLSFSATRPPARVETNVAQAIRITIIATSPRCRPSLDDADGQRPVTARVEDVSADTRQDALCRLEIEPPLEQVRRAAMLVRELRESLGVTAGAVHALVLKRKRLVDLPV